MSLIADCSRHMDNTLFSAGVTKDHSIVMSEFLALFAQFHEKSGNSRITTLVNPLEADPTSEERGPSQEAGSAVSPEKIGTRMVIWP